MSNVNSILNNNARIIENNIRIILLSSVFVFIVFFIYYALIGYKERVDGYLILTELLFGFSYIALLSITRKRSIKVSNPGFYVLTFIYAFLLSLLLRWLFIEYTGKIFQDAVDSYGYDEWAQNSIISNRSLITHLVYVEQNQYSGLDIDDYGFNVIVYIIYYLFGVSYGRWMMLFINAVVISLSAALINKMLCIMQYSSSVRTFCVCSFAFFTFFPITAAVGLKENIFVFFISLSMYYTLKYKSNHREKYLILAIFSIAFTFLFRLPIGIMLLLSLLAARIINEKNQRKIKYVSFAVLLFIFLFLEIIFETVFGVPLEHILAVSEGRIGEDNNIGWYAQIFSSLLGPFPNYSRSVQYSIISSYALQFKCMLNFFAIYALFMIVKRDEYKQYWISLYLLMGIVMMTTAAVSLDMRYHVTFFPALILLIAYSLENVKRSNFLFFIYSIFNVIIVFLYNSR